MMMPVSVAVSIMENIAGHDVDMREGGKQQSGPLDPQKG